MSAEHGPSSLLDAFILRQTEPFMPRRQRSSSPPLARSKSKRLTTDIPSSSNNNNNGQRNKRIRQNPSAMTATTVHTTTELSENQDMLRLCIDLPGVSPKDVQVAVEHSVLSIKATRRSYSIDGKTCLREHHILKRYGLNIEVLDITRLAVKLVLGVLTITVPKKSRSEEASPPVPIPQDEEDSQTKAQQLGDEDWQSTGVEDHNQEHT